MEQEPKDESKQGQRGNDVEQTDHNDAQLPATKEFELELDFSFDAKNRHVDYECGERLLCRNHAAARRL